MNTVEEVMNKTVETRTAGSTVTSAAKRMAKRRIGSVLVVAGTEIIGIVTSTDILYKVIAKGMDPKKTVLKSIMSEPIHAIGPQNTLKEAADMMKRNRVKKLPVINKNGELIGIITASDILAADKECMNMLINLQYPVEGVSAGS